MVHVYVTDQQLPGNVAVLSFMAWPSLSTHRPPPPDNATAPHPLSPLTAAEIETASAAVKATQKLDPRTARFVYISLYEPAKHDVIAFENGTTSKAPDRLAKVVLRERAERATYEGVVRLPSARGGRGGRRSRGRRLQAHPRRAAERDARGVPRRRGHRPPGPALAGGHAQARHRGLRPVHDRPVVDAERRARRRPDRRPLRLAPHLGPQRHRRQRLRPPGRERPHARRPGHAHRRHGRRRRRRPDPEEVRQLLHRRAHRPRQRPVLPRWPQNRRQAVRHRPARGPQLHRQRPPPRMAEVGPADRLHPPRGPGPAPDQLRRPLDHLPREPVARCSSPTATRA